LLIQNSKILIVDDVIENIQILEAIIKREGYEVFTTDDGYKALNLVKEQEFDLILLDIMMPGISGLEVCRYLKIDPQTTNIPRSRISTVPVEHHSVIDKIMSF